ncbi:MAG: protein-(glutamine-N5) methyltransferase, release factor-specific [Gammaproteobacteria bacterium RIFCSPHIGHO2_12_FULL_45_9]|nr:MAG: protein-(glutamine-N5) methyltransferase, release factor-specific [Gammaproteobacteria bacterium RIFCSPHIGHO2_12_FULL_45_9]
MTVRQWLATAPIPRNEAEWLLESVLRIPRITLYQDALRLLSDKEHTVCNDLVARRMAGEPLAYVTGQAGFWRFSDWTVTQETLIPRPETEHMVEWILAHITVPHAQILELGVGSGVLITSLLHERAEWQGVAIDISEHALHVARTNAEKREVDARLQLLHSDWYQVIAQDMQFDVIVSNPPYLRAQDEHLPHLLHEPQLALVAGETGLEALSEIIQGAAPHLKSGGWLAVEHGYDQGDAVARLFHDVGFLAVKTHHDLAGHARFCVGRSLREAAEDHLT